MVGIENPILGLERIAVGKILGNEVGIDGAIDNRMADVNPLRPKFAGQALAIARKPCLAPENAANWLPPRILAVAPVKIIVPRPRATMRCATSRAVRKPAKQPISQIL